jgi:hypothetical protein
MTMEEYIKELEIQLDSDVIEKFKDWPVDTKLYMYLHHIQLQFMADYMDVLRIAMQIYRSKKNA